MLFLQAIIYSKWRKCVADVYFNLFFRFDDHISCRQYSSGTFKKRYWLIGYFLSYIFCRMAVCVCGICMDWHRSFISHLKRKCCDHLILFWLNIIGRINKKTFLVYFLLLKIWENSFSSLEMFDFCFHFISLDKDELTVVFLSTPKEKNTMWKSFKFEISVNKSVKKIESIFFRD